MTFSIHNILFCYLPCSPLCLHHLPNHNNNNNNLNSADHKNRKRRNSIPTRWLQNVLFKYIIGLRRIHFLVQEYSILSIFHSSGSRSRYANSPCSPLSLQLQSRIIIQGHKLVNYNFDSCLPFPLTFQRRSSATGSPCGRRWTAISSRTPLSTTPWSVSASTPGSARAAPCPRWACRVGVHSRKCVAFDIRRRGRYYLSWSFTCWTWAMWRT